MSGPSFSGSLVEELQIVTTVTEVILSATTLLAYTQVTTLDYEITYAWKHPLRLSSIFYLLMRYPPLLFQLVEASLNTYTPDCTGVVKMSAWMYFIAMAASYAFQIVRTWAITDRKIWVAVLLTLLCLPALAVDFWSCLQETCANNTPQNVFLQTNIQLGSDFAFESVVVILTIYCTWTAAGHHMALGMTYHSLPYVLLRNGLSYYIIFTITNVGAIIFFNAPSTYGTVLLWYIFYTLNHPLRWVLLSRFVMDLRRRQEQRIFYSNMSRTGLPESYSGAAYTSGATVHSVSLFHATSGTGHNAVQKPRYGNFKAQQMDDFNEPVYPSDPFPTETTLNNVVVNDSGDSFFGDERLVAGRRIAADSAMELNAL